jgi:predicted anti-sigma-YlaC factor YlaD
MVALGANQPSESLNRIIENHIEKCEECQDWALQNGRSYEKWIYPGND